jgi:hypothetical protein
LFSSKLWNRIGGVLVIVFASSAKDCGLKPLSGKTKEYKIGITAKQHTTLGRKCNYSG